LRFLLYPIPKGWRSHWGHPNCGKAASLYSLLFLSLIHLHQKQVPTLNNLRPCAL
jgi:hypothetical protein